jgi:formate hydrogenlyase subunit 6/NADH:ubiquinone oxidoreductase subunit I
MADQRARIEVFIMGEAFLVPEGSTIIQAIEYAGFQLKRGVGCREGYCGACGTIYREHGDYKLKGGLGCQTVVTPGMAIAQIPFTPAEKPAYDLDALEPNANPFKTLYPSVFRCVACNTCTKACPQEIKVMDYIQALIRGDVARAANLSFDCIRCGLCALRCPAEIVQYNAAMLAQRLYGKYLSLRHPQLPKRLEEIQRGDYEPAVTELVGSDREELSKRYFSRELKIDE